MGKSVADRGRVCFPSKSRIDGASSVLFFYPFNFPSFFKSQDDDTIHACPVLFRFCSLFECDPVVMDGEKWTLCIMLYRANSGLLCTRPAVGWADQPRIAGCISVGGRRRRGGTYDAEGTVELCCVYTFVRDVHMIDGGEGAEEGPMSRIFSFEIRGMFFSHSSYGCCRCGGGEGEREGYMFGLRRKRDVVEDYPGVGVVIYMEL